MIVIVEPGFFELLRLRGGEHAERCASLQTESLDALHHSTDLLQVAILGRAPGSSHAEAGRPRGFRRARFREHRVESHEFFGPHTSLIKRALWTISAILRA